MDIKKAFQLQQQTQAADIRMIRMGINLPYVEGTSEILRLILRSPLSILKNTFRKLLCKPKDQAATENNIVYEIDCSNYEGGYFGVSKRSLTLRSDERKRSFRNCNCKKNKIAKYWFEADHSFSRDQKKVIDGESRLIPRKIKKYILCRILITLRKFLTCFLKFGFLIYGILTYLSTSHL